MKLDHKITIHHLNFIPNIQRYIIRPTNGVTTYAALSRCSRLIGTDKTVTKIRMNFPYKTLVLLQNLIKYQS